MSLMLHDLGLVLGMAAVTSVVFRWIRQPPILGYLLAGLAVGSHMPFPALADPLRVHALSELGVVLVMFAIGLEFSMRRLGDVLPRAGFIALVQIGMMLWLGEMAGRAFGWTPFECLFLGAALSISSTMIVARTFAELDITGPLSELVLGILIVEDLAAVVLLAVLTTVAATGIHATGGSPQAAGPMIAGLGLLVVGGMLVVPRVLRRIGAIAGPETLLIVGIGLCFGLAIAADAAGFSVALGAFLAGMFVAESGLAGRLIPLVMPLRDMFAAVFFVSVGMLVDPAAIWREAPVILVLVLLVVVARPIIIAVAAFLSGRPLRTSVRTGMSLAHIGEFSFIIVAAGAATGVTGERLTSVVVAVAVLTTFATPWLIRASEPYSRFVKLRLPRPVWTFVALYAAWIEPVSTAASGGPAWTGLRRNAQPLLLCALALSALVLVAPAGWASFLPRMDPGATGIASLTRGLLAVLLGALAAALLVGIYRGIRNVSAVVGAMLRRPEPTGAFPLTAAHAVMDAALQCGIAVMVGGFVWAATRAPLPAGWSGPVLALAVAMLGFTAVRSLRSLRDHLRTGSLVMARTIRPGPVPADDGVPTLAPAGPATARIPVGARSSDRTLTELDLHGRFGATVTGLIRIGERIRMPAGAERLTIGDVLVVRGSGDALAAARAELEADGGDA